MKVSPAGWLNLDAGSDLLQGLRDAIEQSRGVSAEERGRFQVNIMNKELKWQS